MVGKERVVDCGEVGEEGDELEARAVSCRVLIIVGEVYIELQVVCECYD